MNGIESLHKRHCTDPRTRPADTRCGAVAVTRHRPPQDAEKGIGQRQLTFPHAFSLGRSFRLNAKLEPPWSSEA